MAARAEHRKDWLRREAQLEARQLRCEHVWTYRSETVYNRLVMASWCRKCKLTAFAFERDKTREQRCH